MKKIYVIEDDENIRNLLKIALSGFLYEPVTFETAEEALKTIGEDRPDMAIFDLMLPGMDGVSAIKLVRQMPSVKDIPILILTAKDKELDKVIGLDGGADDYMVKPFDAKEVVARIKAVLRRCQTTTAAAESTEGVIEFDNLRLDMNSYELRVKGKVVEAPPKELELLNCLASHPNRVYTRDQLLDEVWGFEYYGDSRTIDVHVKRLREKLAGASDKWELKTVWGVGYKFEVRQ